MRRRIWSRATLGRCSVRGGTAAEYQRYDARQLVCPSARVHPRRAGNTDAFDCRRKGERPLENDDDGDCQIFERALWTALSRRW